MIVWVEKPLTLAIHNRQLAEHGGASGVRDEALLAFAEERAKLLTEGDSRVEAFEAMAFFLLVGDPPRGNNSPEWALAKRLGSAFGLSDARTLRCLVFASGRTTGTMI